MDAFEKVTLEELQRVGRLIALPMIVLDFQKAIYINDHFMKMTGYTLESFNAFGFKNILDPTLKYSFFRKFAKALKGKNFDDHNEFRIRCHDGRWIWVDYKSEVVIYEGKPYVLANLLEVTEKKELSIALSKSLKIREALLEVSQSVMETSNVNDFFHLILSKAVDAIPNAELGSVLLAKGEALEVAAQIGFQKESIEDFNLPLKESFLYKVTKGRLDAVTKIDDLFLWGDFFQVTTEEKDNAYIRSTITAPLYIEGEFFGTVNVDSTQVAGFDLEDVKLMTFVKHHIEIAIANRLLYQEKIKLSRFDVLTGLYNRSYFEDLFNLQREKALRYKEPFQLVIFDMDNLKEINDAYGHLVGDEMLKIYANKCSELTRKSDVLARYGGDEFVGLFFGKAQNDLTERLDNMLREIASEPVVVNGHPLYYAFSYGVATFPEDGIDLDGLFRIADERMYAFKEKNKP